MTVWAGPAFCPGVRQAAGARIQGKRAEGRPEAGPLSVRGFLRARQRLLARIQGLQPSRDRGDHLAYTGRTRDGDSHGRCRRRPCGRAGVPARHDRDAVMILYALRCDAAHEFEAWFRDGASFDRQAEAGVVTCPICGSTAVEKALMTPRVARHHGARDASAAPSARPDRPDPDTPGAAAEAGPGEAVATAGPSGEAADSLARAGSAASRSALVRRHFAEALRTLQAEVERTCDDVGDAFAEEARRIHYGETEPRGIRGHTTEAEADALREEGVSFATIPWPRRTDG